MLKWNAWVKLLFTSFLSALLDKELEVSLTHLMKRSKMSTPLRRAHFDNCGLFFQKFRVFQTVVWYSLRMPFPDCGLFRKYAFSRHCGLFSQNYAVARLWYVLSEVSFPASVSRLVCSSRICFLPMSFPDCGLFFQECLFQTQVQCPEK